MLVRFRQRLRQFPKQGCFSGRYVKHLYNVLTLPAWTGVRNYTCALRWCHPLGKTQMYKILGWPKSPFIFFHKIKDAFFIFTNNLIDLDIWGTLVLSHVVECWLFSINALIWSPSTSTGPADPGASSSKKSPARNFNHFPHVHSVAAPSPHTALILFLHFRRIFTFLEVIKQNTLKMLPIFFRLEHKNGCTKSRQFWWVFFKCTLMWQLSPYSLPALFQIPPKTIKHHQSHLTEKTNEYFGQPNKKIL